MPWKLVSFVLGDRPSDHHKRLHLLVVTSEKAIEYVWFS